LEKIASLSGENQAKAAGEIKRALSNVAIKLHTFFLVEANLGAINIFLCRIGICPDV